MTSERLGLVGVTITMDIYSHILSELRENVAGRFSKLLANTLSE